MCVLSRAHERREYASAILMIQGSILAHSPLLEGREEAQPNEEETVLAKL
jgi:hypothetical protein